VNLSQLTETFFKAVVNFLILVGKKNVNMWKLLFPPIDLRKHFNITYHLFAVKISIPINKILFKNKKITRLIRSMRRYVKIIKIVIKVIIKS